MFIYKQICTCITCTSSGRGVARLPRYPWRQFAECQGNHWELLAVYSHCVRYIPGQPGCQPGGPHDQFPGCQFTGCRRSGRLQINLLGQHCQTGAIPGTLTFLEQVLSMPSGNCSSVGSPSNPAGKPLRNCCGVN